MITRSITRPITRPITAPIARAVTAAYTGWNPRALFAAGEIGFLDDQLDFATLYQDAAGVAPVTASGQPVGLRLDKRLGQPVARRNLLTHTEDFASSAWVTGKTAGASVASNTHASPVGGTTADSVTFAASGDYLYRGIASYGAVSGVKVAYSLYATTSSRLIAFGGASPTGTDVFSAEAVGGGWYRQTLVRTFTETAVKTMQLLIAGTFAGAGTFVIWGAQFEAAPSASAYQAVPTGAGDWTAGNHASQPTASAKPFVRDAPRRIDYDADDSLVITFQSALGSNCTVARSIPGVGAQILTAQTIGTSYTLNVDSCADVIINRALTPTETANLTRHLNQRAGV